MKFVSLRRIREPSESSRMSLSTGMLLCMSVSRLLLFIIFYVFMVSSGSLARKSILCLSPGRKLIRIQRIESEAIMHSVKDTESNWQNNDSKVTSADGTSVSIKTREVSIARKLIQTDVGPFKLFTTRRIKL